MIDPQTIWDSPELPTLPTVAIRLLELSRVPDAELKEMASLIKTDPAIAANILRAVNSSCFGLRSEVVSIERAMALLGSKRITTLALSFSISQQAIKSGPMREHYRSYWLQSVVQAAAAEIIAEKRMRGFEAEFFLTGLMTDIGRLAMLKVVPNQYLTVLEATRDAYIDLQVVERTVLGFDHVDVGVRLLENWNLPGALIRAARLHHAEAGRFSTPSDEPGNALVGAIAMAAAAGDCYCTSRVGTALVKCHRLGEVLYGWSAVQVESYLEEIQVRIDPIGELFDLDTAVLPDTAEILDAAAEQLELLSDPDLEEDLLDCSV